MSAGSVATSTSQNAILEPSGTSIVIMAEGTVSRPQAAFSLMQCSIDPFSEHFLPDIAWTLDGKCLCAITTHGQLFVISGACVFIWCLANLPENRCSFPWGKDLQHLVCVALHIRRHAIECTTSCSELSISEITCDVCLWAVPYSHALPNMLQPQETYSNTGQGPSRGRSTMVAAFLHRLLHCRTVNCAFCVRMQLFTFSTSPHPPASPSHVSSPLSRWVELSRSAQRPA